MAHPQQGSGSPAGESGVRGREKLLCVHCLEDLKWKFFADENSLRKHQGRTHNCWHRNPPYQCNRCERYFDQKSQFEKHQNLTNCLNPGNPRELRMRPEVTHPNNLQRRADIWRTKEDGPMNPALIVPRRITFREPADMLRRRYLVWEGYRQGPQHHAQNSAARASGVAAPMPTAPAGPQMNPQPGYNGAGHAAHPFAAPQASLVAGIGSGPAQSFQQPQQLPYGQGAQMPQGNLGQFGDFGASSSGMQQYMPPPQVQQQQHPQAAAGGQGQYGQPQAFHAPSAMAQGSAKTFFWDADAVPNHLDDVDGAIIGQQAQHHGLQNGSAFGMIHFGDPNFNDVMFNSPGGQQGLAAAPRPVASPSGTDSAAGRRRSADEAFGPAPDRVARGAGQQQAPHPLPSVPTAPGMLRSASTASGRSPRAMNADGSAAGAQRPQQMARPEPGSRRAGKQPVRAQRTGHPGCAHGNQVDDRAQQAQRPSSRVPEMSRSSPAAPLPVRAVPEQQTGTQPPELPQQPPPPPTREPETLAHGVGDLEPTADDLSDSEYHCTPEQLDAILADFEAQGMWDHTTPAMDAVTTGLQDLQPAPTAPQDGGSAASGATAGSGDETLAADVSRLDFDEFLNFDE